MNENSGATLKKPIFCLDNGEYLTQIFVVFDCNDSTTTTGAAVIARMIPTWDTAITRRHNDADTAEISTSESYAHGISNPQYVPIRSAIPIP